MLYLSNQWNYISIGQNLTKHARQYTLLHARQYTLLHARQYTLLLVRLFPAIKELITVWLSYYTISQPSQC